MSEALYSEVLYEKGKIISTERLLERKSLLLMSWDFKAILSKEITFTEQTCPTYKVTSTNGRTHVVGKGTKYLTQEGWKPVEDLCPDDLVALLFDWARTTSEPCPLDELDFLYRKEKDTPEWSKKPLSIPAMQMQMARRASYLPSINNRVPQKVFASSRSDTWKYLQLMFKLLGTRELAIGKQHFRMWGFKHHDKFFLKDLQLLFAKIGFQSNLIYLNSKFPAIKMGDSLYFLELPLGDIQRYRRKVPIVRLNQHMYPSNTLHAWDEKPDYLEENNNKISIKYKFLYDKVLKIELLPECLCHNPSEAIISSSGFITK